jgi:phytoene desaturase (3,4-didehydrolycopene-forming)
MRVWNTKEKYDTHTEKTPLSLIDRNERHNTNQRKKIHQTKKDMVPPYHHHVLRIASTLQLVMYNNTTNNITLSLDRISLLQRISAVVLCFVLFCTTTQCWAFSFPVVVPTTSSPAASVEASVVVIVGGGIGGLAVASRIATATNNTKVIVVEKNAQVGGRCGSFHRHVDDGYTSGTFRHERGPSLLLLPHVYQRLFTDCGTTAEMYNLTFQPCIPAYQVVFDDGDTISLGFPRNDGHNNNTSKQRQRDIQQLEQLSRDTMNRYETNGAHKWDTYMRITNAYLNAGLPNFIEEQFDWQSLPTFVVEVLRDWARAWPLKPHSDVLDAIFESTKMKALASFQDLYVGLEPYRNHQLWGGGVLKSTAPAVFGLLAAIEIHPTNPLSGVYAPTYGGFQSVTNAIQALAQEHGVEFQCNTLVTSIESTGVHVVRQASSSSSDLQQPTNDEENAASSTKESSSFLPADLVIVNADLPYATQSLFRNPKKTDNPPSPPSSSSSPSNNKTDNIKAIFDWDDQFTYSLGVIAFHWCVNKVLDDLNTHNVFLMASSRFQAESSWEILRTKEGGKNVTPSSNFNFYVHCPSATDVTAAPSGCDAVTILVPCRTLLRDEECARLPRPQAMERYKSQFTPAVIDLAREAVLTRLEVVPSLQDLRAHIVDEVVDTPATWADQFHLAAGTPFALVRRLSSFRHAQRGKTIMCADPGKLTLAFLHLLSLLPRATGLLN